jgi:hypothetical protein
MANNSGSASGSPVANRSRWMNQEMKRFARWPTTLGMSCSSVFVPLMMGFPTVLKQSRLSAQTYLLEIKICLSFLQISCTAHFPDCAEGGIPPPGNNH